MLRVTSTEQREAEIYCKLILAEEGAVEIIKKAVAEKESQKNQKEHLSISKEDVLLMIQEAKTELTSTLTSSITTSLTATFDTRISHNEEEVRQLQQRVTYLHRSKHR